MINCRVISVNINNQVDYLSVQEFGHNKGTDGRKIRYLKRRQIIDHFMSNFNNSYYDLKYFDAITPSYFSIKDNKTYFEDKVLESAENSIFYIANILSHYSIWNIEEDTLVLEDDVIFDIEVFSNIKNIIEEFKLISGDNKVLYLQLSTPWLEDAKDKNFLLDKKTENIGKYISGDISGTGAYYITKEVKKTILKNIKPLTACDKYMDTLQKEKIIEYYLPLNKEYMFKLNKDTMWL